MLVSIEIVSLGGKERMNDIALPTNEVGIEVVVDQPDNFVEIYRVYTYILILQFCEFRSRSETEVSEIHV